MIELLTNILDGVKIIDLTRYYSGPFCTLTLADLGADVLKIEHPSGDETRAYPPFTENGNSAYFATFNRGKRSRVLDLKNNNHLKILLSLIKQADVVVENFGSDKLDELGLSYEAISNENPRIILASLKASSDKEILGFDLCVQAMSGIMDLNHIHNVPQPLPIAFADGMSGIMTTVGILSALYNCLKSGKGQHIKIYMLDTYLAMMEHMVTVNANTDILNESDISPITPYGTFKAKDGYFVLAVGNENQWSNLVSATNGVLDKWKSYSNLQRIDEKQCIDEAISLWAKSKNVTDIVKILQSFKIPGSRVNTVKQALEMKLTDPDFLVSAKWRNGDKMTFPSLPIRFAESRKKISVIPDLGQDDEFEW